MLRNKLARWLAVSAGLLALSASAQTVRTPAAVLAAPASAAAATSSPIERATTGPGAFRSTLEHYQPYREGSMVPWRQANDSVGRIGGWRAYAREAAELPVPQDHAGHAAPAVSAPASAARPAKPHGAH